MGVCVRAKKSVQCVLLIALNINDLFPFLHMFPLRIEQTLGRIELELKSPEDKIEASPIALLLRDKHKPGFLDHCWFAI